MDYQKYMQGGQGGDYKTYMDYQQYVQGGDYQKYMQGVDYQKYMKDGGQDDASFSERAGMNASGLELVAAPATAESANSTEQLEAWRKQQESRIRADIPASYQHFALAPLEDQYRKNLARIKGEAAPAVPYSAADCKTMEQLEQWRAAAKAKIEEFTPKAWQGSAVRPVEEEFARNKERIEGKASSAKFSEEHAETSARAKTAEPHGVRSAPKRDKSSEKVARSEERAKQTAKSEEPSEPAKEVAAKSETATREPLAVEASAGGDAAPMAAMVLEGDDSSPTAWAGAAPHASASVPWLATAGFVAAFALAVVGARAAAWRQQSRLAEDDIGAPFSLLDAVA